MTRRQKKADQALAWPAPMGSEGEGGTPKPTASNRPGLPAVSPSRTRCPRPLFPTADPVPSLSPQKLGLKQARRKGTPTTNPWNCSDQRITGAGCRRIRHRARRAGKRRGRGSGRPPPAAPGPLAPACASGRIAEMPGDPVELAVLAAADLLPRGASVLVACSGGPDSVALAGALARCAPEFAIRLAVGHVDHGLRPESARDAEHVREVARQLGLPFHLHRLESLDVRPLGLEGAARPARKPARTASRPRTRGATRRRPCCCASRAAAARGRWPACGAAAP